MSKISRDQALAHFGVKGMRWGVRNEEELKGRKKSSKQSTYVFFRVSIQSLGQTP